MKFLSLRYLKYRFWRAFVEKNQKEVKMRKLKMISRIKESEKKEHIKSADKCLKSGNLILARTYYAEARERMPRQKIIAAGYALFQRNIWGDACKMFNEAKHKQGLNMLGDSFLKESMKPENDSRKKGFLECALNAYGLAGNSKKFRVVKKAMSKTRVVSDVSVPLFSLEMSAEETIRTANFYLG